MKFDVHLLCEVLNASHERLRHETHPVESHLFHFRDSLLEYQLLVRPVDQSVLLVADPEEPLQGCPLLEYGFACSEIETAPNLYDNHEGQAVRFWQHRDSREGIRLTLTPRGKDRWYIWANALGFPTT